jgi:hypothetical protein
MSVYLHYNEQQTGPYSEDQVRQMIQGGLVPTDALAWREGMADWIPVAQVVGTAGGRMPAPPASKKSMLGWTSLVVALLSIPTWLVLLVIAGMAAQNKAAPPSQGFNVIVGAVFLLGVCINFFALVLGAIGTFTARARTIPILGACLNGFMLVALVGLVILGLAVKHQQ